MKVGIISDTHISKDYYRARYLLENYFKDVDIIIHAGDYTNEKVIEVIKDYKDFIGVSGNVDNDSVKELLKEKEIITLEGYRIGIYHGHGNGGTTLERAYNTFENDRIDIVIFGHSHQPLVKTKKGILMLNPGSLTSRRQERWFSYIILELQPDGIKVHFEFIAPSKD
jgi:putative phosphoesterase